MSDHRQHEEPETSGSPLTFVEVESLYNEVLSNAFFLSQDAGLLLNVGSTGHARALATLALEECGKAIMIHKAKVTSYQRHEADPVLDEDFWKAWRRHQVKLREVRDFVIREDYWFDEEPPPINELLLGDLVDYAAELDRWAAAGDTGKLRGLYVDMVGRRVTTPALDASADEVIELIEIAHQIGWQLRLGDHIQFIASQRSDASLDPACSYSAYADGGPLARSLSDGRGWEAQGLELARLAERLGL